MESTTDHVDRLLADYPRIFKGQSVAVGASYPKGWDSLMRKLCGGIDRLLNDSQADRLKVEQIKEKFGGLRFYYAVDRKKAMNVDVFGVDGHTRMATKPDAAGFPVDALDAIIREAERESMKTCMDCGAAGSLRMEGWYHVCCDACEARRVARAKRPRGKQ